MQAEDHVYDEPLSKRQRVGVVSENVASSSEYIEAFVPSSMLNDLKVLLMDKTTYLIYMYARLKNWLGEVPLKRAPKFEWYISSPDNTRPLYRWGQSELFQHAGSPMPQVMLDVVQLIYDRFGERVNHAIAIDYKSGVDQHAPPHKDKAKGLPLKGNVPLDMNETSSFFVISFGEPRKFTLQQTSSVKIADRETVWESGLAEGSLLKISAADNRQFYHAVHKAGKSSGRRLSLIFRNIDTYVPIDVEKEHQVNHTI